MDIKQAEAKMRPEATLRHSVYYRVSFTDLFFQIGICVGLITGQVGSDQQPISRSREESPAAYRIKWL